MNISIAIADTDRDYVSRLSEVLQQYDELTIHIYTNGQKLQQAIDDSRFDVVLFDPDISDTRLAFSSKVKLPVCLYSDEAHNAGLYADLTQVIKYQRVSNIYKEVVKEYAEVAGYSADFDMSQSTFMLAVYSPVGGCGKTTVALALASAIAAKGTSVLFLNIEQLSSSFCVNPQKEAGIVSLVELAEMDLNGGSMGKKEKGGDPKEKEQVNYGLKVKGLWKPGMDGMYYIEGFDRLADYDATTAEDMSTLLSKIKRSGVCSVIIIDMGSGLDAIGKAVLAEADRIAVIERAGELPAMKMKLFAQQGIVNEHKNKMVRIYNFVESNSRYGSDLDVPLLGSIHNYGNAQLASVIHSIGKNGEIAVDQIMKR